MEYRTLGRTGLRVSRIGFGGAPAGIPKYLGDQDRDSEEVQNDVVAALREAVAQEINYFDVAPGYGEGRAERLYGRALEPCRDRIILATKYWIHDNGWTPAKGTEQLRESLDNLKTDRVDILQLHGLSIDDSLADRVLGGGVLEWADEMRAKGFCRFTGITAESPSGALERLLRTERFDTILVAYNLIYQCFCDYQRAPFGIIPLARTLGMGVATMRPTTSGFLQKLMHAEFPELDGNRLTRLAINFVLSTPEVDCAVVGMRTREEVIQNAALASDLGSRFDIRELHNRFS